VSLTAVAAAVTESGKLKCCDRAVVASDAAVAQFLLHKLNYAFILIKVNAANEKVVFEQSDFILQIPLNIYTVVMNDGCGGVVSIPHLF
jgi:hypothetical protein